MTVTAAPSDAPPHRGARWWVALVASMLGFALACGLLAQWQWSRYQDKAQRQRTVERNYDATPRPVAEVLPGASSSLGREQVWTPVRVTGTYDRDHVLLARNRPYDKASGYEVLVPLRPLDGGPALLVDRGWIPAGRTGAAPDSVPPPPPGRVEVVARLKAGEPAKAGPEGGDQLGSIHLPTVAARTSYPILRAYGVLASETPPGPDAPRLLPRPEDTGGQGINASYAVQWVLIGLLGLATPVWLARRDRADARRPEGAAAPAPKERRRRIWDDEDE